MSLLIGGKEERKNSSWRNDKIPSLFLEHIVSWYLPLVFITTTGINIPRSSKPEKKCELQEIKKGNLDINIMPIVRISLFALVIFEKVRLENLIFRLGYLNWIGTNALNKNCPKSYFFQKVFPKSGINPQKLMGKLFPV